MNKEIEELMLACAGAKNDTGEVYLLPNKVRVYAWSVSCDKYCICEGRGWMPASERDWDTLWGPAIRVNGFYIVDSSCLTSNGDWVTICIENRPHGIVHPEEELRDFPAKIIALARALGVDKKGVE
jgi:hypothetical protein